MEATHKKSRAWEFIVAATVLLLLFAVNSLLLAGESGTTSTSTLPLNTFLSFILASAALTVAVMANVSAFINPQSAQTTKILSPIILVVSFIIVAPFFIALGLTLIR